MPPSASSWRAPAPTWAGSRKQAGQTGEAEKAYGQALAIAQKLAADFPGRSDYQSELGQIQRRLAGEDVR